METSYTSTMQYMAVVLFTLALIGSYASIGVFTQFHPGQITSFQRSRVMTWIVYREFVGVYARRPLLPQYKKIGLTEVILFVLSCEGPAVVGLYVRGG